MELHEARNGLLEASARYRGIRHVRRLEWEGARLTVRDRIEGRGRHELESRLVWAGPRPLAAVEPVGGDVVEVEETERTERLGERSRGAVTVLRTSVRPSSETGLTIRLP